MAGKMQCTLETRASLSHLTPHKWGLFSTKERATVESGRNLRKLPAGGEVPVGVLSAPKNTCPTIFDDCASKFITPQSRSYAVKPLKLG